MLVEVVMIRSEFLTPPTYGYKQPTYQLTLTQ